MSTPENELVSSGDSKQDGDSKGTQLVAGEQGPQPTETEKEVLVEFKTYNFILLLVGVLIGMGIGYIIWVFVRKDLIFWFCAAIGLIVARILEIKKFPQNVVRIWVPKNMEEMLHPPVSWKGAVEDGNFYVQSDMYDVDKQYVRSTAVYHDRRTCALAVRERFVSRSRGLNKLAMSSPYVSAVAMLASLIFSAATYLNSKDAGPNVSVFLICIFVLVPLLLLVAGIIEIELRKRRFFSFAKAEDYLTYIPLHTIGNIEKETFGANHWNLLYVPPEANNTTRKVIKIVKAVLYPVLLALKFVAGIILILIYNGAFAIWIWLCIATIVLYQAHMKKEVKYAEPAMTLLWIAFAVNVFEIWYCSSPNGLLDTCLSADQQLKKLQLDSDTRLPREKVQKLFFGFIISLIFIFISAVAMTSVTHGLFKEVEFFNFDDSWKQNYKENAKFILCEKKMDGRRLGADIFSDDKSNVLQSKYSSEYDALCRNQTFYSTSVAVAFATIDWFLLLILTVYWHTYDKYQTKMKYNQSDRIWRDFTRFYIHYVSSQVSWLGRIIGNQHSEWSWFTDPDSFWFYLHPADATKLHRYLTENVPWFAILDPKQPGAAELMPRT